MTLKLVGRLEDLDVSFSLMWEEVGLYVYVSSYMIDSQTQEYNVTFPEEVPFSGVLKLNNKTVGSIRDNIVTWVDNPKRNREELLKEIVKEVKEFLEKELKNKYVREGLIIQILEGEVLV